MIYLDNAATSFPKAPGVAEAVARFLTDAAANPGRAGHRLAVAAETMVDDVRLKLARLFDADDHHRMILTLNGTDALNLGIKGVLGAAADGGGGKQPHVITTVLEHNSVSRPLASLKQAGRIDLTRVTADGEGFVDPEDIRHAITSRTALIVMTHASNVLGTIQDAEAVGRIAREHEVLFLLDAAQTAGVVPLSVRRLKVDLLALPGHKSLLGPTGTGVLHVGPRCPAPDRWRPLREGGTGGDSSSPSMPSEWPYRLEGGTPNTAGIAGLSAALDYIADRGDELLAHERALVRQLIDGLSPLPGVTIHGPADVARRVGTVSIGWAGMEPADLAAILDDSFDIAVRGGLHCAPYAHRHLGTFPDGTVRISPGPFNAADHIDALIEAVEHIAA